MFRHFSLRGVRAAMAAVAALAAAKRIDPKGLPPIEIPAELMGKRRRGMSAKSGYGRQRGRMYRDQRLRRATGEGSYDQWKAELAAERAAKRNFIGPHGQIVIHEANL